MRFLQKDWLYMINSMEETNRKSTFRWSLILLFGSMALLGCQKDEEVKGECQGRAPEVYLDLSADDSGNLILRVLSPPSENNSYEWSTGARGDSITVYSPGNYTVIATNSNGCEGANTLRVGCSDGTLVMTTTLGNGEVHNHPVVQVGSTCWCATNLRSVQSASGNALSDDLSDNGPAYQVPEGYLEKKEGYFYNLASVSDNVDPCPLGWRTARIEDWLLLLATNASGLPEDFVQTIEQLDISGEPDIEDLEELFNAIDNVPFPHLKAFSEWSEGNQGNNATGIQAVPQGYVELSGSEIQDPPSSVFWSSLDETGLPLSINENSAIELVPPTQILGANVRCIKEAIAPNPPMVTTGETSDQAGQSISISYEVENTGGSSELVHGICWSRNEALPIIGSSGSDTTANQTVSAGQYEALLNDLLFFQEYHYRAYAYNPQIGQAVYGAVKTFTLIPESSSQIDLNPIIETNVLSPDQVQMLISFPPENSANINLDRLSRIQVNMSSNNADLTYLNFSQEKDYSGAPMSFINNNFVPRLEYTLTCSYMIEGEGESIQIESTVDQDYSNDDVSESWGTALDNNSETTEYPLYLMNDSLIWMGSNKETRKYSDGSDIMEISNNQWSPNSFQYQNVEGNLYFNSPDLIAPGLSTCPVGSGWRIPSKTDFEELIGWLKQVAKAEEVNDFKDYLLPGGASSLNMDPTTGYSDGEEVELTGQAFYWTMEADGQVGYFSIGNDNHSLGDVTNTNRGFTLRCVKKRD